MVEVNTFHFLKSFFSLVMHAFSAIQRLKLSSVVAMSIFGKKNTQFGGEFLLTVMSGAQIISLNTVICTDTGSVALIWSSRPSKLRKL